MCNEIKGSYDKIIITIVPSYTGKNILRLLPLALLFVLRTHSNTDGNKLVIFSSIASYYGDNYTSPMLEAFISDRYCISEVACGWWNLAKVAIPNVAYHCTASQAGTAQQEQNTTIYQKLVHYSQWADFKAFKRYICHFMSSWGARSALGRPLSPVNHHCTKVYSASLLSSECATWITIPKCSLQWWFTFSFQTTNSLWWICSQHILIPLLKISQYDDQVLHCLRREQKMGWYYCYVARWQWTYFIFNDDGVIGECCNPCKKSCNNGKIACGLFWLTNGCTPHYST